jgi:hypothetical protein
MISAEISEAMEFMEFIGQILNPFRLQNSAVLGI